MKKYDLENKIDTRTIDLKIWGVEEKEYPPQFTTDTLYYNKRNVEKYVEDGFDGNGGYTPLTKEEWDKVYENKDQLIQLINENIEDYLIGNGTIPKMITELLENK